jgi:hypothetical protein
MPLPAESDTTHPEKGTPDPPCGRPGACAVPIRSGSGLATLRRLTPEQVKLLVWIVESAPDGALLFIETGLLAHSGKTESTVAVPDGPHRVAHPTDFRELVALGLLRQVDTHRHEVTSAGRDGYRALKTPPDKPRTVGFQPPNS